MVLRIPLEPRHEQRYPRPRGEEVDERTIKLSCLLMDENLEAEHQIAVEVFAAGRSVEKATERPIGACCFRKAQGSLRPV